MDVTLSSDRKILLQKINHQVFFEDLGLLDRALTHASFSTDGSNETLEFLGDVVLDLVVRECLYRKFPEEDEGRLTERKISLVNEETLSTVAEGLNLGLYLLLGDGEDQTGGREKSSILSGTYEAIIGGLFVEGGLEKAKKFIQRTLLERMEEFLHEKNFKGLLQEKLVKERGVYPEYRVLQEKGKDHEKTYRVNVKVHGKIVGVGEGRSRKEAEMRAAESALLNWSQEIATTSLP